MLPPERISADVALLPGLSGEHGGDRRGAGPFDEHLQAFEQRSRG